MFSLAQNNCPSSFCVCLVCFLAPPAGLLYRRSPRRVRRSRPPGWTTSWWRWMSCWWSSEGTTSTTTTTTRGFLTRRPGMNDRPWTDLRFFLLFYFEKYFFYYLVGVEIVPRALHIYVVFIVVWFVVLDSLLWQALTHRKNCLCSQRCMYYRTGCFIDIGDFLDDFDRRFLAWTFVSCCSCHGESPIRCAEPIFFFLACKRGRRQWSFEKSVVAA